jgi:DNA-binding PadR family transcriptional regulator
VVKRRKVGNLLALAILGTLTQRPMHPYEMASILRERGKDEDMPIKWGSLYTVVRNLEKHRFIEATGSLREGGRPERTIYRITEAGSAELTDWVRELLGTPEREQTRFKASLSMLGALGPDEAIGLLEQRLRLLEEQLAAARAAVPPGIPRLFLVEDEYDLAIREAEVRWVRSLLDELTTGTFEGVEMWRAFRATGEVPPELRDLSERGGTPSSSFPPRKGKQHPGK